ncbi:hypothetical protein ABLN96_16830 [Mycobacterium tuberculosis]|uniref:hypothetical protein n=1 Tax=Mycobacterium tuberculosis TaxID=1773 RepID=UPI0032B35F2B
MPGSSSRRKRRARHRASSDCRFLLAPQTARIVTGRRLIARFLLAPQTARIVTGRRLIARFLLAPQTARIVTGRRLIARFLLARKRRASSPGVV